MQLCCCITPIINIWNQNCAGIYVKRMRVIKSGWFSEFCNGGSLNSKSKIFWLHKYNTCGAKKVTCICYVYECIMFYLYIQKYKENMSCRYLMEPYACKEEKAIWLQIQSPTITFTRMPTRQTYQRKKIERHSFNQTNNQSWIKSVSHYQRMMMMASNVMFLTWKFNWSLY